MNYWDYREEAKKLIPRMSILTSGKKEAFKMKEKGRKSNYQQHNLQSGEMVKIERLLDTENINSFVEVSLRAQSCPMPLNIDVYDGLKCPFQCRYCVPAGTKILMADGSEKNAERIRMGDRVHSINIETMEPEPAEVVEVQSHEEEKGLWDIQTESHSVSVTGNHPIFTKRGWIVAEELTEEDEVVVW